MVDGTARQKTHNLVAKSHVLSKSDHVFHNITKGTKKKAVKKANAKAIPLYGNDDFNKFNS